VTPFAGKKKGEKKERKVDPVLIGIPSFPLLLLSTRIIPWKPTHVVGNALNSRDTPRRIKKVIKSNKKKKKKRAGKKDLNDMLWRKKQRNRGHSRTRGFRGKCCRIPCFRGVRVKVSGNFSQKFLVRDPVRHPLRGEKKGIL